MLFLDRIKEYYPKLENIFEVGAHRGNDIYEILKRWPDANIFAFEADPYNFQITQSKFVEYKNVNVYHMAISDQTGHSKFFRYYPVDSILDKDTFVGQNIQHTGQGSILKPGVGMKSIFKVKDIHEEIDVKTVSLFDFCAENNLKSIDAIFMDIQGAEYMAFDGCKELLHTLKATVFEWSRQYIMYENEQSLEQISQLLNRYGLVEVDREYQFVNISGDSLFIRGI